MQSPEAALEAARQAAAGRADDLAARSASKLFFTAPEVLVAGAPAVLYFNRARSWPLANNPNIKVGVGRADTLAGGWQGGRRAGARAARSGALEEVVWW